VIAGTVFDIKRFSIHDGPGIRTTVFFKGCPLSCRWCHNPESQALGPELIIRDSRCIRCGACLDVCDQGALSQAGDRIVTDATRCTLCGACVRTCYAEARELAGRQMTVEQLMAEIGQDGAFFDESGGGVTFSGGEPLAQPDLLLALLHACAEQEIHTALDTCGFASWATLDRVRPLVGLFLYDLKLMDDARHREFTGMSNKPILRNLRALSDLGHDIVLRLPVIPGINDDEENLRQIGTFVTGLPRRHSLSLLPYHRTATDKYERLNRAYLLSGIQPPSAEQMMAIADILVRYGLNIEIGG
jgi:pyruvate formate lyase activating enzyme